MAVAITSGPGNVITSGEVTTFGAQPLRFALDFEGVPVTVELAFRSDPSVPDVAVGVDERDGAVRFDLVNFDGADGRGSARPVLLAEVGQALLFFHFRVFRWGRTDDRTVHFTLYKVFKHDVDWRSAR